MAYETHARIVSHNRYAFSLNYGFHFQQRMDTLRNLPILYTPIQAMQNGTDPDRSALND
jgi:hypothetical protein